jgi:membrane protein DedA with SNARE-associated domain
MNSLQFLSQLIGQYGLYAVFFLVMLEGDITLLLAGVLANSRFFGDHSFAWVLLSGTLGGVASDNLAYAAGRAFGKTVRNFRFYRAAKPRIERLTERFGPLSIFLSKYIYGLRWALCVFHGVGRMRYLRFLLLSLGSCFLWVLILSGAGYFFSSAVMGLIGDFRRLGRVLLVIVVFGIVGFYFIERFWVSKKVEEGVSDRLLEIEQAAVHGIKEFSEEVHEKIHRKSSSRREESDSKQSSKRDSK